MQNSHVLNSANDRIISGDDDGITLPGIGSVSNGNKCYITMPPACTKVTVFPKGGTVGGASSQVFTKGKTLFDRTIVFTYVSSGTNWTYTTVDNSTIDLIDSGTDASKSLMSDGNHGFVIGGVFQSSDQVITSGGALTIAHGLGRAPSRVWTALVNQTGEAGYTTGQVVYGIETLQGTNGGASVVADATNLVVRFGSGVNAFSLPDATTGASTALTNADWKIRFFAI